MHSEVLRIGPHKNSTTLEFLAAVRPQLCIISAGVRASRPSPLERLKSAGVKILRADRDGVVNVLTDGARMKINCFVVCVGAAASVQPEAPYHQQDQE